MSHALKVVISPKFGSRAGRLFSRPVGNAKRTQQEPWPVCARQRRRKPLKYLRLDLNTVAPLTTTATRSCDGPRRNGDDCRYKRSCSKQGGGPGYARRSGCATCCARNFFGSLPFSGRLSVILLGAATSAGKARRMASSVGPSQARHSHAPLPQNSRFFVFEVLFMWGGWA